MKTITKALLLVLALSSQALAEGPPKGWFMAGASPTQYESGIDRGQTHSGRAAGYLKAKATPKGFGTLMQMFKPDSYAGKRVRLSAWVRTENVESWAGLWLRIDGRSSEQPLAFDNMQDRPLSGTHDWTRCEVVLDVAPEASAIAFGLLLDGTGKVWIDDVKFEVVGPEVKTTNLVHPPLPAAPQNLGFEP